MTESNPGFFAKLKSGLSKTKSGFVQNIESIMASAKKIDEELFNELEDSLIMADVGVETSALLVDRLREIVKDRALIESLQLKEALIGDIQNILESVGGKPFDYDEQNKVYLVVGVNGVGKTTTIAKLGASIKEHNRQVLFVAADTFRAAATEQLMLWGERTGIPVVHHQEGADPAAVVFDGMAAGKARKAEVIIIDTAGRLHTKINLMEELKKVKRVILQNIENRKLETLLVLDATTGQNAVSQAKIFHEALNIDRLILTKLDGTAKGGISIAIANQLKIPICLIGVGEKKEDLQEFNAKAFTKALFE
jgi:fused signal recognition particle receptor